MKVFQLQTTEATELLDITGKVSDVVRESNWKNGVLTVFCPHTTASITLNENWDADVRHDILLKLNELISKDDRFRHGEGNSDAHIKTSLFGSSATVIVEGGKLRLGQWQGIYFVEWDGPRQREVWLQFVDTTVR